MTPSADPRSRRAFRSISILGAVVASLALVFGFAAPAQAAGGIDTVSGVVTQGTAPAHDVGVNLFRTTAPYGTVSTTTDAEGNYSFTGISHGTYLLSIYGTDNYPAVTGSAIVLSAAHPNEVANLRIGVWPSGTSSVSGVVTDLVSSLPIEGATVRFDGQQQAKSQSVDTDSSGAFTFDKLPGGAFSISVMAADYAYTSRHFALTDGGSLVQDFAVGQANSSFTGTIIDDGTGTPILGVEQPEFGPPVGPVVTVRKAGDESFRYSFGLDPVTGEFAGNGLGAGDYTISFGGPGSPWKKASAVLTLLPNDVATTELHSSARQESFITGKVTAVGSTAGVATVCIDVFDDTTKEVVSGGQTTSAGTYTTGDLDPGTYDLMFWDCSLNRLGPDFGRNPGYATTFLGGSSWLGGVTTANKVVVTAGTTVTGKNMALKPGASISGHVNVSVPGGPIEFIGGRGMDATLYQFVGGQWEVFPDTSSLVGWGGVGGYSATGLPAGTYRVGFSDMGPANYRAYAPQFWPAASTVESGTSITIVAGQKKTGVNVSLRVPRPDDDPTAVGTGELAPVEEDVIDAADTAAPGSSLSVDVGTTHAGEWVSVWGHSTPTAMGSWTQVDKYGKVAVTVPTSLAPGDHDLVVQNASGGVMGWTGLALAGGPYPSDAPGSVVAVMDSGTNTLSATLDEWPMGTGFSYQWFRSATSSAPGTAITGASTSSYALTPADAGQFVKVLLTATVPGYAALQRFSTATNYTLVAGGVPTITGEVAIDQSISVVAPAYSSYDGEVLPGFTYQWLRNGAVITSATGNSYTPMNLDAGKTLSVRLVASAPGHLPVSTTSASTQPLGTSATALDGWNDQPNVTVTQSGAVLTAASDGVTATGVTRIYQWFRGGVAIAGATKLTYTLTAADSGKAVHVVVTIKKATFTTIVKASLPADYSIVPSGANSVTGTAKVGQTLSVTPVTYSSPKDGALTPTLAYSWFRNGVAIAGASGSSYTLAAADLNLKITARVTATLAGYVTQVGALTAPTAVVAKGDFSGTKAAPIVSVSATGVLSASLAPGAIDAVPAPAFTLGYQWYRSGVVAPVGTAATYQLTAADAGKSVSLKLTVNKAGYTSAALDQTAPVDYSIAADGAGSIPSTAKVGDTLTVTLPNYSTRDGALSPTLVYAWLRNGAVIAGATAATYDVQSVDFGTKLSVRLTATTPGSVAKVVTTAATASVTKGVLEVNSNLPNVTASPTGVLTASLAPGTTTMPAPTLTYKWLRNTVAIAGATGSTYKLAAADAGKLIAVSITVTKANTTGGPFPALVSEGVNYTLVGTSTITVTGEPRVGVVFGVTVPSYTVGGAPISTPTRTYQWLRNGAAITGATGATYLSVAADLNTKLSVRVTAVSASTPLVDTTLPTATLGKGVFEGSLDIPTVTLSGQTLTAALPSGSITTPGAVLTYQWYRLGVSGAVAVSGATKSTYTITAADYMVLGGTNFQVPLYVRVTATRPNFVSVPLDSEPTSYGILANDDLVITGDPVVGQTLTATPRAFNIGGVTESYQWLRDGVVASGATSSTYLLSSADLGKAISVRVTANAVGYVPLVTTSAALPKLTANPLAGRLNQPQTTVTFAPATKTISVLSTGITEAGTTATYQWYRDNNTLIPGATKQSYTLAEADYGLTVWVRVTTSKATFTTNLKDSAKANYQNPAGVTTPTIDNTAPAVGETLSASTPVMTIGAAQYTPSASELTYEWIADGWFTIPGATSSTYVVDSAYLGQTITVKVTLTVVGMPSPQSRESAPTAQVAAPAA